MMTNKNISITITFLATFSATQDIVTDAYRIESAPQNLQGPPSSMYIAGYRLAMLVGGAGSLWIASYFGSETYDQSVWKIVYLFMALLMTAGIITTIILDEPKIKRVTVLLSIPALANQTDKVENTKSIGKPDENPKNNILRFL